MRRDLKNVKIRGPKSKDFCLTFPLKKKYLFLHTTYNRWWNTFLFQILLEYVKIEIYDVFLMFTSASCNEQLLSLTRKIENHNKPVFFVQILQGSTKKETWANLFLMKMLKETWSKVHRIDVDQQNEYDFCKLIQAITDVLPTSKGECFHQIPKVGGLLATRRFMEFVKGSTVLWFILSDYDSVSLMYC